jgi:hypothetical protein
MPSFIIGIMLRIPPFIMEAGIGGVGVKGGMEPGAMGGGIEPGIILAI